MLLIQIDNETLINKRFCVSRTLERYIFIAKGITVICRLDYIINAAGIKTGKTHVYKLSNCMAKIKYGHNMVWAYGCSIVWLYSMVIQ